MIRKEGGLEMDFPGELRQKVRSLSESVGEKATRLKLVEFISSKACLGAAFTSGTEDTLSFTKYSSLCYLFQYDSPTSSILYSPSRPHSPLLEFQFRPSPLHPLPAHHHPHNTLHPHTSPPFPSALHLSIAPNPLWRHPSPIYTSLEMSSTFKHG